MNPTPGPIIPQFCTNSLRPESIQVGRRWLHGGFRVVMRSAYFGHSVGRGVRVSGDCRVTQRAPVRVLILWTPLTGIARASGSSDFT